MGDRCDSRYRILSFGVTRKNGFICINHVSLQWRHNERDSVSNHQAHDCLLNCLLRHTSKKPSKLRVTGLCAENSPGTGEFPAQKASNAENVSIWWRHHVLTAQYMFLLISVNIIYTSEADLRYDTRWQDIEPWVTPFCHFVCALKLLSGGRSQISQDATKKIHINSQCTVSYSDSCAKFSAKH